MAATPGVGRFRLRSSPKKPTQTKSSRKSHSKSRNGCQECKRSRVKCDEKRPICGRCSERRSSCMYVKDFGRPDMRCADMSIVAPPYATGDGLVECNYPEMEQYGSRYQFMTKSTHLLQHLHSCLDVSLGSSVGREIFGQFVLPQCVSTPYLMHALLALSARHLQHCQSSHMSHRKACWLHTQTAARLLREQLVHHQVGAHNIDWIYASSLLINMVSFASDETTPYKSWFFRPSTTMAEDSLSWFTVQMGLGYLKRILHQNIERSLWRVKGNAQGTSTSTLFSRNNPIAINSESPTLPGLLCDLCNITPGTSYQSNPYYIPLRIIIPMLQKESLDNNDINNILRFGPRVTTAYRSLLYTKDERALLLFMLWLDFLDRGDVWWIGGRARNERLAILIALSGNTDGRRLDILALYRANLPPNWS